MATLQQILSEQVKLITEAKKALETAHRKPPAITASIAAREATLADLKSRSVELNKLKTATIKDFDEQLKSYETEIATLEKQIEEDRKRFGDQPVTPRAAPPKGGRKA